MSHHQASGDFSFRTIPLEGCHLIEASAGTGKTWTLTALYLRLLVERDLTVEQILVVTFTEAATRELKSRIRDKLQGALARMQNGETPAGEDPFDLLPPAESDEGRRVLRVLNTALRNLDRAAVHTIHGFCSRILRDHAFASGLRFDVSVRVDDRDLQQQIIDDFWRRTIPCLAPQVVRYLAGRLDPDRLLNVLQPLLQHPDGQLDCAVPSGDLDQIVSLFEEHWLKLKSIWTESAGEVKSCVLDFKGFKGNIIKADKREQYVADLYRFMESGPDLDELPKEIQRWQASRLEKAVTKGNQPPDLEFFRQLDGLNAIIGELLSALQAEEQQLIKIALETLCSELPEQKNARGEIGFQDMLLKLREALRGPGGTNLSQRLREIYRAALIDEFQDTDPVQWDIFRNIFRDGSECPFYLIGDPKQAIYGFRGGDIHTYLAAARSGPTRHGLRYNHRSITELVAAVNRLFTANKRPFLSDEIRYQPVTSRATTVPLREPGFSSGESLLLVYPDQRRKDSGKQTGMGVVETRQLIRDQVTGEILRLLDLARRGEAWLGERPLKAGDIAVLVKTNREAEQILSALMRSGVNAAIRQSGDVFETPEAEDWRTLLVALLQPGAIGAMRGALTTRFFQFSCEEIVRLDDDPARLGQLLVLFRDLRKTWERFGVMSLTCQLMEWVKFPARVAAVAGGERSLANLLQIAELLHEVEYRERPGMVGLQRWLERRIFPGEGEQVPDEHMVRLASEEDAVAIVTMHASKGLEYPVVFCTSTWEGRARSTRMTEPVMCHDSTPPFSGIVLDLGGARYEEHRAAAQLQRLAESMRLLYVAVTRGCSRVYLFGAPVTLKGMGALEYLLFHRDGCVETPQAGEQPWELIENSLQELASEQSSLKILRILPEPAQDAMAAQGIHPDALPEARRVQQNHLSGWRIASFTSLSRHDDHAAELPDRDDRDLSDGGESLLEVSDLLPRGRVGGNLFHAMMEEIDFSLQDVEYNQQVCRKSLRRHGQPVERWPGLIELAERVLRTPLDDSGFCLQELKAADRRVELEFHYPLEPGSVQDVPALFARLDRQALRGYLKGFIDLVFRREGRYYLLDWKTNNLGQTALCYSRERLEAAILQCNYNLQQAVYSVALHRHLRSTLAGYSFAENFGGVHYLFVRGMDPQRGSSSGVWSYRPREEELAALDHWLGGGR